MLGGNTGLRAGDPEAATPPPEQRPGPAGRVAAYRPRPAMFLNRGTYYRIVMRAARINRHASRISLHASRITMFLRLKEL